MKKLFLLGTLSFSIAFSLGMVVEKDITKSAVIGGIATISTIGSTLILNKKSDQAIQSADLKLKNIENKVLKIENKEQKLLQLIDNKTKEKIAIEQEYNAIIQQVNNLKQERDNLQDTIRLLDARNKEYSDFIKQKVFIEIETDTLYANNLISISKDFLSIYKYNVTTFRNEIPRRQWGYYWSQLRHGFSVLSEETTLLTYFAFYGSSHYYKLIYLLEKFFEHLSQSQVKLNIDIIDYGCGQALGTMCFLDYLKQHNLDNIKIDNVTLIEPSQISLSRGFLHIKHLDHNLVISNITFINKELKELNVNDLSTSSQNIKVHLFSNILDVSGFDINHLAKIIEKSQSGINYFLCVSPTDRQGRIEEFLNFWYKNIYNLENIQLSNEDLYKETWKFKSDQFQCDKIHRVQKLFLVKI